MASSTPTPVFFFFFRLLHSNVLGTDVPVEVHIERNERLLDVVTEIQWVQNCTWVKAVHNKYDNRKSQVHVICNNVTKAGPTRLGRGRPSGA